MWLEPLLVRMLNRVGGPKGLPQASGLRLGHLTDTGAPVVWPDGRRAEHLCVVGKTGTGKTHFLEVLADQLMTRGEPWIFFDYHGDATEHLIRLASRHPHATDRLMVVDPSDEATSPGLNPLEPDPNDAAGIFGRSSEVASILRQRWQVDAFGPRTEELLRNTLYVLAATGQTLAEAPRLLSSPEFRQQLLLRVTNAECLEYWLTRFEPLSEPMKAAFREPLLNKITGFLSEPACRHFLGQATSTIHFGPALDRGAWIILCLPKGRLREHAHTLGNLIFARLQFDLFARVRQRPAERRLSTLFCDEVQNLAENNLEVLLTEGRKFQCSVVSGQQHWAQASAEMRGALLSAATHVFFRTSSADAGTLASELSVSAKSRYQRELTLLSRGQAIARIGAGSPASITVPTLPTTDASRVDELRRHAIARCARSRAEIDAEFQRRRTPVTPEPPTTVDDAHDAGQTSW